MLSLGLVNVYTEYIKKMGVIGDKVPAIGRMRGKINTTTQADDAAVLVERKNDMIEPIK
jgi:hypothetical protein